MEVEDREEVADPERGGAVVPGEPEVHERLEPHLPGHRRLRSHGALGGSVLFEDAGDEEGGHGAAIEPAVALNA